VREVWAGFNSRVWGEDVHVGVPCVPVAPRRCRLFSWLFSTPPAPPWGAFPSAVSLRLTKFFGALVEPLSVILFLIGESTFLFGYFPNPLGCQPTTPFPFSRGRGSVGRPFAFHPFSSPVPGFVISYMQSASFDSLVLPTLAFSPFLSMTCSKPPPANSFSFLLPSLLFGRTSVYDCRVVHRFLPVWFGLHYELRAAPLFFGANSDPRAFSFLAPPVGWTYLIVLPAKLREPFERSFGYVLVLFRFGILPRRRFFHRNFLNLCSQVSRRTLDEARKIVWVLRLLRKFYPFFFFFFLPPASALVFGLVVGTSVSVILLFTLNAYEKRPCP